MPHAFSMVQCMSVRKLLITVISGSGNASAKETVTTAVGTRRGRWCKYSWW